LHLYSCKLYSKNEFYRAANLLILAIILALLNNSDQFDAYSQIPIHPTGSPCLLCFYTIEDKAIDLGITPRRAGTAAGHLNFDFTMPVNGNLTQTTKGLLYSPNKHFVGNDTFLVQIQNNSSVGGYSTTQVKIVVGSSGNSAKTTAQTFESNEITRQIQTASQIIGDIHNLEQQLYSIVEEREREDSCRSTAYWQ
jgi:hypothetical protein